MNVLIYIGFAAALPIIFLVPGWLWLRRAGVGPLIAVYAGFGVSVGFAGGVVGLALLLPWSVPATCSGALVIMAVSSVWCWRTAPRPLLPPRVELAGLVVFLVGYASLVTFVAVPSRPYGYYGIASIAPGLIDSARWSGSPSDNTLPYRTGQVALHKLGGAQIRDKYAVGWWISDRTPLTGLAFAFAAGGLHVTVPADDPTLRTQTMQLRDGYGFWAYNAVAILLNYAIVLGTYLLARVWCDRRRIALVAGLIVALAPGVTLNSIYTWPKQAVAYFILVAAACAIRRRPGLCGVLGALGYLCHPGGAFWLPALAFLVWAFRDETARFGRTLTRYVAAVVATVLPWQLFVSLDLHASSRLALEPLGYELQRPTDLFHELPIAWQGFRQNGILFALWNRISSLTDSLVPADLTRPAGQPFNHDIVVHWTDAHGFSWWGMLGIVVFPAAVVMTARHWTELRRVFLWLALPALITVFLGSGVVPPFMSQSMFALLGIIAVPAAMALCEVTRGVRIALIGAMAFELLTVVWFGLYAPFNISTPTRLLFSGSALAGQLGLLAALAIVAGGRSTGDLGLIGRTMSSRRTLGLRRVQP